MNTALQKEMLSYVQWKFKSHPEMTENKIPVEENVKQQFHEL